ncbi:MAG: hypothetical protein AAGD22_06520 [Verrucomicrobiota bacterium]
MIILCGLLSAWGALNFALNSEKGRLTVSSQVTRMVGVPLEYDRASFLPWGVVRLKGVKMAVVEEQDQLPPFLACRELEVKAAPLSFFHRNVRVTQVALKNPVFSVVRNERGELRLPAFFQEWPSSTTLPESDRLEKPQNMGLGNEADRIAMKESVERPAPEAQSGHTETKVEREDGGVEAESVAVASTEVRESMDEELTVMEEQGGEVVAVEKKEDSGGLVTNGILRSAKKKDEAMDRGEGVRAVEQGRQRSPLIVRFGARNYYFGDFVISEGAFQFLSFDERPLLEVSGIDLSVGMGGIPPEGGEFNAAKAIVFGQIEVKNLRSPIFSDGSAVVLSQLEGDFRGGQIEGRIDANFLASGLPFLMGLQFREIPMEFASELFGGKITFSEGFMTGQIQMLGLLRAPGTYQGRGKVRVTGARLEKNQFLGRAGPEAGVELLEGFGFEDMSLGFILTQGQVLVEELSVVSPDLSLSARGYVGLSGALNLAARVYISERVYNGAKALEDRMGQRGSFGFKAYRGSSRFYRDYSVQGALFGPTIDFLSGGPQIDVAGIRDVLVRLSYVPEDDEAELDEK